MAEAVAQYAGHRRAPDRWALGRFVVPLSRWHELESEARRAGAVDDDPWPVSVLAGLAETAALGALASSRGKGPLWVGSVECRADSPGEVSGAAAIVALGLEVFVEVGASGMDLDAFARAVRGAGAAAKVRTGGVTADAFPEPAFVLRFLRACHRAGVRFKATAGLHHAIRGEYRLTYAPGSPTGQMYGFLNVMLAAAFVWAGRDDAVVLGVLVEQSPEAFEFSDDGVTWRGERLTRAGIDSARADFLAGFGSCSFSEPLAELGLQPVPAP